jgi:uncharacterized lipoprotein YajG
MEKPLLIFMKFMHPKPGLSLFISALIFLLSACSTPLPVAQHTPSTTPATPDPIALIAEKTASAPQPESATQTPPQENEEPVQSAFKTQRAN